MISQQAGSASFPGAELTREIFGNVSLTSKLTFYLLAVVSLAIFGYGIWSRWVRTRRGVRGTHPALRGLLPARDR